MIRIPLWLLRQLIRASKINPADVLTQSNIEDLIHLAKIFF